MYCNICLPFTYSPCLPFAPVIFSSLLPSVPLSPPTALPGERGAGSAADVGGGAEEARGGREEASGRDGPQAEAGGRGGEDERETLLPGQWSSGRRRAAGRTEKRGGVEGGDGRLGERMRGERLKRGWEYGKIKDCSGKGENGMEGGEKEQRDKWMGDAQKNIMYT